MTSRTRGRGSTRTADQPAPEPGTVERHGDTVDEARAVTYGQALVEQAACGIRVPEAAKALGLPESTAYRYYDQAIRAAQAMTPDAKRAQLVVELETLRLVQQANMPQALRGHVGAGQLVVAISKRRGELIGLDAAIEVNVSTTNVRETVAGIVELVAEASPMPPPPSDLPELPPPPAPRAGGE